MEGSRRIERREAREVASPDLPYVVEVVYSSVNHGSARAFLSEALSGMCE